MRGLFVSVVTVFLSVAFGTFKAFSDGNPARGQRVFGACAACHSLQQDQNMTGPSLAGMWNRKAGSLASFNRYSPALRSSNIVWNDNTLDEWLTDPQHLIPGNQMTFAGIKDARQRADLLAFLKEATKSGASVAQGGPMGGMAGMMGGGQIPNLKSLDPANRVQEIAYCKDTYTVTTVDGQTRRFWERNLRLKTDSSADGPEQNAPALVPAGMMGDRADVIFANPSEITAHIANKCRATQRAVFTDPDTSYLHEGSKASRTRQSARDYFSFRTFALRTVPRAGRWRRELDLVARP